MERMESRERKRRGKGWAGKRVGVNNKGTKGKKEERKSCKD